MFAGSKEKGAERCCGGLLKKGSVDKASSVPVSITRQGSTRLPNRDANLVNAICKAPETLSRGQSRCRPFNTPSTSKSSFEPISVSGFSRIFSVLPKHVPMNAKTRNNKRSGSKDRRGARIVERSQEVIDVFFVVERQQVII